MEKASWYDEFDARSQQTRRLLRFAHPLRRRAIRRRFAARTNHEMNPAAAGRLPRHHAATAEFDIVRMRAKREQRRGISGRLRPIGRWGHD